MKLEIGNSTLGKVSPGAAIVAGFALLAACFWWTGGWMITRWETDSGYYSHGWLVLPVSVILLWMNRKQLAACPRKPNLWGLVIVAPALLLHLVGVGLVAGVVSGIALIGLLAGLALTLFGWRMLKLTWFPIMFLLFMVPMPAVVIEKISFNMKLMAAGVAAKVIDFIGLVVVRDGSIIHLPASEYIPHYQRLVVDDVCSGLKYLISLTAFGALYAYIAQVKYQAKAILFMLSVPISFVANVLRVILMVLVAYRWGVEKVEGRIHDFFGIMLFVVAFVFLFLMEWLLCRFCRMGREEEGEAEKSVAQPPRATPDTGVFVQPSRALPWALLALLAVTAAGSVYLYRPLPAVSVSGILDKIPRDFDGWQGVEGAISDYEMEILGTRNVLSVHYKAAGNRQVRLLVVMARQTRKRTHPPEQCYRGEGYRRRSGRDIVREVSVGAAGLRMPMRELVFDKGSARLVVWYFFKCGDELSAGWWGHQARVAWQKFLRRDAADILIRVDTGTGAAGEQVEEARKCLQDFLDVAMPTVLDKLP